MSPDARRLAESYWPGPLTLVLTKSAALPATVTGGRETVGVRVPDHPVALALVKEVGSPIVATSANASGGPPPKTAGEAIRDVGEKVSVVLDGGPSRFGIASTVVDMTRLASEGSCAGARWAWKTSERCWERLRNSSDKSVDAGGVG